MASDFVDAAALEEVPNPGKLCLEIDDHYVVVVRIGDEVFCVDDVCTHDGGPLGEGELEDQCLVCPRHGAKFDVRTGDAVTMPATEPTTTHEVRIVDGRIQVKFQD